jgi:outer membrane protein insertion porin family
MVTATHREGSTGSQGLVGAAVVVLAVLLSGPFTAGAAADEASTIRELRVIGNDTITKEMILAKLLSRVGRTYDQATVDADLRSLFKTKWFSDVKAAQEPATDGDGVILTFYVQEMPVLAAVEFRGANKIGRKTLEDHTGLKVGARADSVKNRAAVGQIRRLYEEKGYELAEVVLLEGQKPGDRRVVFQIFEGPKVRIARIRFTGNTVASDALLNTKIGSRIALFSWFRVQPAREGIEDDVRKLTEYYQSLGYFDAKVSATTKPLNDPGQIELEFVIHEGIPYTVRDLKFVGNEKLSEEKLREGMQLHSGKSYSDALRTGDAKTLQQKYTAIGCIDVQIVPEPKFTDQPGVVDLVYRIEEGDQFNVGAILVHGNQRTQDKVIRRELLMAGLAPGEPLDATKLEVAMKRLQNLQFFVNQPDQGKPISIKVINRRGADQPYGEVGAPDLDAVVRAGLTRPEPPPITRFQSPDPEVPELPRLTPSEPLAPGPGPAGVVPFGSGGVFSPPLDAVPVIPVPSAPGGVVAVPVPGGAPVNRPRDNGTPVGTFPSLPGENMTDVGPDRQEPFQNRGLANIATQVEPGPPRNYADIDVAVDEAPTGRLALGIGATSYGGLSGNFILHERNFDILNFPRSFRELFSGQAFRGAGQELRIEASPGTQINRFVVSFREPYLFDLPIGLGVSGYVFGRQYPDYFESRGGGRFSLGKQFGSQIYADVAMRVENVNLSGFRFPTPSAYLAAEGNTFLATIRPSLRFDNRNDPFLPSQGQYLEVAFEQGWGTFTFPKVTAEGRTHFTVWQRPDKTGKHIFTLRGFVGATGRDTPTYERFYAGDFRSMRGFAYRGVGPRVFGQNVGGIFTLVGSAEYQFPIVASDKLQMVVFSDFGTVESDYNIHDFRVSVGTGVRIVIPALGPLPLAFDIAYPVSKVAGPNGDRTRYFTFFIGAFW